MNKFHKIFTALLALATVKTTLPMNRLARIMSQRAPKFAAKTAPALAISHPSPRKRYDVTLQPNFNEHGKQRNFSRPYPWLPALGAATAIGMNWQQKRAECLVVDLDVVPVDENNLLIFLDDLHVEQQHQNEALDHAQQALKLYDYFETLKEHRTVWFTELGSYTEKEILTPYAIITQNNSRGAPLSPAAQLNLQKNLEWTALTLKMAMGRAIAYHNQTSNVVCENFDLRRDPEATANIIATSTEFQQFAGLDNTRPKTLQNPVIKEQQEFSCKCLQDALGIVQNSNLEPSLKRLALNAVQNHYYESDPNHNSWFKRLKQKLMSFEYTQFTWEQCIIIHSIPSEASLLVKILCELKQPGKKIILIHAGAKHIMHLKKLMQKVNMLSELSSTNFDHEKYKASRHQQQKQFFVNNYAQRIIAETESWLQTPQPQ